MTEQEQRIAIAKECGTLGVSKKAIKVEYLDWRGEDCGCYYLGHFEDGSARPCYTGPIPDYLHDLNAMHEAEKTLTDALKPWFIEMLWKVVGSLKPNREWEMIHATAVQRAEAFLRTVGKWKDAP